MRLFQFTFRSVDNLTFIQVYCSGSTIGDALLRLSKESICFDLEKLEFVADITPHNKK